MSVPVDIDYLRRWIGTEEITDDVLTPALAERFHHTLSHDGIAPGPGQAAPRFIHFCLCHPAGPMRMLGQDGHPDRGGFLPPVPLPHRMWAGSSVVFHGDLKVGDVVRRSSRIADVVVKLGRSGTLCFVTIDHLFSVDGEMRVEDRQSIVYRSIQAGPPTMTEASAPAGEVTASIDPTPTLLFRYSALTFNGHRIHYDAPYARDVEGYPGLVVHGPLQATLLLDLAERQRGTAPRRFDFRSMSTLYGGEEMLLHAGALRDGTMPLWTARPGGSVAMQAQARWS